MEKPREFAGVTALVQANVYFDGKVVSHTILLPDGSKKTLGLIYPGTYKFDTGQPERMEITSGDCRARLPGEKEFRAYPPGSSFQVPGRSAFEIAVDRGIAQYVCSFLPG